MFNMDMLEKQNVQFYRKLEDLVTSSLPRTKDATRIELGCSLFHQEFL